MASIVIMVRYVTQTLIREQVRRELNEKIQYKKQSNYNIAATPSIEQ
jgi:hypothetical protein